MCAFVESHLCLKHLESHKKVNVQAIDLMVARGGIEPPTRGFSGTPQKPPIKYNQQLIMLTKIFVYLQINNLDKLRQITQS